MITLSEYWQGRDVEYANECTDEIKANAAETLKRANKLLALAEKEGIIRNEVSSGWRPKGVNSVTSNAAKGSNHLLAKAVDIRDPLRELAQWTITNKHNLSLCFLWAEDFRWCAKKQKDGTMAYWCHYQILPPKSGKLIYIPSNAPPTAPKLLGQGDLPLERII